MNDIKYLGVPILEPPAGFLPSKEDTVKFLHGYNGGSIRGYQGLGSICCLVIIFNHHHHLHHSPRCLMAALGSEVLCVCPDH